MAPTLDDLLKELRAIRHEVGITRVLAEASLGDAIAPETTWRIPSSASIQTRGKATRTSLSFLEVFTRVLGAPCPCAQHDGPAQ